MFDLILFNTKNQKEFNMANCCDMKEGDVYYCDACGLELEVKKTCTCKPGSDGCCSVPLTCCGKEMALKDD